MSALAATATDALIAQFSYEGGTAGADINGDMTTGYGMSLGYATLHASLDGVNARKLEWTSNTYTHGDTSMVEPIMAAGNNNPWAVGAYIELRLPTKGYSTIMFSAKLGGTKKGPRDFQLQYSLDEVTFKNIASATYSIATNKTMFPAFEAVALPQDAANAATLYIRIAVASNMMVNGTAGLIGGTSGETAINHVTVGGTPIATTTAPTTAPTTMPTTAPTSTAAVSTTTPSPATSVTRTPTRNTQEPPAQTAAPSSNVAESTAKTTVMAVPSVTQSVPMAGKTTSKMTTSTSSATTKAGAAIEEAASQAVPSASSTAATAASNAATAATAKTGSSTTSTTVVSVQTGENMNGTALAGIFLLTALSSLLLSHRVDRKKHNNT